MKRFDMFNFKPAGLLLAMVLTGISGSWADTLDFQAGIKAYRDGQYAKALEVFEPLHQQHPEDSNAAYYVAISLAQLGRFSQARAAYQKIMLVDPQSKAAKLAEQGLKFLPQEAADSLDLPPRFQAAGSDEVDKAVSESKTGNPPNPDATNNAQDMQALQAMMMQMNMGNNSNNNSMGMTPMMMQSMMQQNGDGKTGTTGIDPSLFGTMMMNQMMQNFSMDNNKQQQ